MIKILTLIIVLLGINPSDCAIGQNIYFYEDSSYTLETEPGSEFSAVCNIVSDPDSDREFSFTAITFISSFESWGRHNDEFMINHWSYNPGDPFPESIEIDTHFVAFPY